MSREDWDVFAGPVANMKRDGKWQALEPADRVTFKDKGGNYYEVWLGDEGELNVRTSGTGSKPLRVLPRASNLVAIRFGRGGE